jgi:D-alanine-D-alanine ligase
MAICYDKQSVRLVAGEIGIEVPRERYLPWSEERDTLPDIYPALLKPNTADGSVGITKDAVVTDAAEARAYLAFLAEELPGRDVLWQEYLPGPEFGLGMIGNPEAGLRALPPLRVDFSSLPAGLMPILSFESKTDPESPYWTDIRFEAAGLNDATLSRLTDWAARLFRRLGLRDYGRFDFRCAADGRPKLLEVNPNPAWANDGKLAFMAGFDGISYPAMLESIIDAALERIRRS